MATTVVTINPIATGIKFLRASSNTSTLQIAATGMIAQGTKVPLPTIDNFYFADTIIISRGIPEPLL
jgi:hypothetical protein